MPDELDRAADLDLAPRTRNPWGQGERLRTEILTAAARLISELGSEQALTVRGIARAAGIAPASIYQHFADKTALVRGLLAYDYELLLAAMLAADESVPAADVVGRVRAQMRAYCRFGIDNPGHYRLMLSSRVGRSELGERPQDPLVRLVVEAFERCAAAGCALRQPARRAAITVFVGAHGRVALWHADADETTAEQIVEFVDDLVSLVLADQAC
jgi:AcrR family transcriptional regulator